MNAALISKINNTYHGDHGYALMTVNPFTSEPYTEIHMNDGSVYMATDMRDITNAIGYGRTDGLSTL